MKSYDVEEYYVKIKNYIDVKYDITLDEKDSWYLKSILIVLHNDIINDIANDYNLKFLLPDCMKCNSSDNVKYISSFNAYLCEDCYINI